MTFTRDVVAQLSGLSQLTELILSAQSANTIFAIDLTGEAPIEPCTSVKVLCLYTMELGDATESGLVNCFRFLSEMFPNLAKLGLSYNAFDSEKVY